MLVTKGKRAMRATSMVFETIILALVGVCLSLDSPTHLKQILIYAVEKRYSAIECKHSA